MNKFNYNNMIYLINKKDNVVTTESWLDYIPSEIVIFLDDINLGSFVNESTVPTYIKFHIPTQVFIDHKVQNMEYLLKIYKDYSIFKSELVSVLPEEEYVIVQPIFDNKIIMKEYE